MQVYRGMDIGTAKPGLGLRKKVRHHLISIVSPQSEFSCADFSRKARVLIKDIIKRGGLPLLVGGSGLYLKALIDGLFAGPSKDQKLRDKLEEVSRAHGVQHLYGENGGPGGMFHTLRQVPLTLDIARDIERLCPDAWSRAATD